MEALLSIDLSIPLIQIALLLVMSTLTLLFGRIKLALILNYCFLLYWCYILNLDVIRESGQAVSGRFIVVYFGLGAVILMLSLLGFVGHRD